MMFDVAINLEFLCFSPCEFELRKSSELLYSRDGVMRWLASGFSFHALDELFLHVWYLQPGVFGCIAPMTTMFKR